MSLPLRGLKWSTFKKEKTMTTEEKILEELKSHRVFQLFVIFFLGALVSIEVFT